MTFICVLGIICLIGRGNVCYPVSQIVHYKVIHIFHEGNIDIFELFIKRIKFVSFHMAQRLLVGLEISLRQRRRSINPF